MTVGPVPPCSEKGVNRAVCEACSSVTGATRGMSKLRVWVDFRWRLILTAEAASTYLPSGMPQPSPSIDGLDEPYYEATRRHELVVQRCNGCRGYQFGPEWICHRCHSFNLGWEKVSGRARIYSWERVWHPVHPALKNACPYVVVLVELADADNVRMVGNLLGDPLQEIVIGSEVEAVFEDHAEGFTLVQWRTVGSGQS